MPAETSLGVCVGGAAIGNAIVAVKDGSSLSSGALFQDGVSVYVISSSLGCAPVGGLGAVTYIALESHASVY